ncbi:hypothetical protein BV898_11837 [Hypsibius exemplaris]|uniref:MANSC domain-containing protein n=1 Tax=Hypsibius exemplaris TaxID=2072580 RepID=A0A1W0WFG3_HYPEX|nr:hypothetical protein BV898_11837 [Hypsibius exemplaris]
MILQVALLGLLWFLSASSSDSNGSTEHLAPLTNWTANCLLHKNGTTCNNHSDFTASVFTDLSSYREDQGRKLGANPTIASPREVLTALLQTSSGYSGYSRYFCGCYCFRASGTILLYSQQTTREGCSADTACLFLEQADDHHAALANPRCNVFVSSRFFPEEIVLLPTEKPPGRPNAMLANSELGAANEEDIRSFLPKVRHNQTHTSLSSIKESVPGKSLSLNRTSALVSSAVIPVSGNGLFDVTLRSLLEFPVNFLASVMQIVLDGH